MSDLFAPLRKHLKTIVTAAVAVLFTAVAIGLVIGLVRSPVVEKNFEEVEYSSGETVPGNGGAGLLLPPPILPKLSADENILSYFDRHPEYVDTFELIPITVEELIQHRKRGVEVGVKAFRFMGEELDILTMEDELVEP